MDQKLSIQTFTSQEFGTIRTIEECGKVLFCGSDIAKALGYVNSRDALKRHCKGVVKHDTLTCGGRQKIKYISEGDLYRLISSSKLSSAERFESWIFDEVLPTIRKTGAYFVPNREEEVIDKYFPSFSESVKLAMVHDLKNQNQRLQQKVNELEPKAQFHDDLMAAQGYQNFLEIAAIVEKGRTKLFDFLRLKKVLCKQGKFNVPYGRFRENGYFKVITFRDENGHFSSVTMVSPKGLNYIYKLIKKNNMSSLFNMNVEVSA